MQGFKAKLGEVNNQKSALAEEKRQLEQKVSSLEQEIASLQASQAAKPDGSTSSPADAEEIQRQKAVIVSQTLIIDYRFLISGTGWT